MATKFRFKNADGTTVDFEDYYVRADYFRSGNLWLCGLNDQGQLGDNTLTNRSSPVQTVAYGNNWKQVSATVNNYFYKNTAAVKTDGTLWVWGDNSYGRLGDNTTTSRSSPVQTVAGGTNWNSVSVGSRVTGAIKTDGTLWLWGGNYYGTLGDNTQESKSSPVQTVAGGTNWSIISVGNGYDGYDLYTHVAAIKTDGTLWTWGYNFYGELGDNTVTHRSSPVQTVAYGTNWRQVSSGGTFTAAIKTDGTLWTWGENSYGRLGDNSVTKISSPVQTVAYGTNWLKISSGYFHAAAIKTDGTLWTWGRNSNGQLGDNTVTHRSSPVQTVAYGTNWKQVSCGYNHTAAIKTDGTLWVWGNGSNGGLGDNTTTSRSSPVQTIMNVTNWKQVTCGYAFIAAIQYQDDYQ